MKTKNILIIPTYNEISNIQALLTRLSTVREKIKIDILFVDDNSPDGTAGLIKKFQAHDNSIRLLSRKGKEGLGKAYIAGFKWAINKGYDVLCQMDADLSHRPEHLSGMLQALTTSDFVIGSRYVPGGGVVGWSLNRKLLSRVGSLYAQTVLGCPIHDMTGGFNMWRVSVLESIELDKLFSTGYSFQIEMKYRAYLKGYSFKEIPIVFEDRVDGQSKMSKAIMKEAFMNVIKLRLRKNLLKS